MTGRCYIYSIGTGTYLNDQPFADPDCVPANADLELWHVFLTSYLTGGHVANDFRFSLRANGARLPILLYSPYSHHHLGNSIPGFGPRAPVWPRIVIPAASRLSFDLENVGTGALTVEAQAYGRLVQRDDFRARSVN